MKIKKYIVLVTILCSIFASTVSVYAANLNIAVLCYHDVNDNPFKWSNYCISSKELEEDLKYFSENGYTFLRPSEMWNASPYNKNIVLTFDDGYEGVYSLVLPLLQKYNAKAATFIIGSQINHKGYLNENEIKALDSSGIVEIGNHTNIMHEYKYNENNLKNNEVFLNDYVWDVKDCSKKIFSILGHGTESIAYPNGIYSDRLDHSLKYNLGYTSSFSTFYGLVKTQNDIKSPMKRIYRPHGTTPQEMENTINILKNRK